MARLREMMAEERAQREALAERRSEKGGSLWGSSVPRSSQHQAAFARTGTSIAKASKKESHGVSSEPSARSSRSPTTTATTTTVAMAQSSRNGMHSVRKAGTMHEERDCNADKQGNVASAHDALPVDEALPLAQRAGSLLDGELDEEVEHERFKQAVEAFRKGTHTSSRAARTTHAHDGVGVTDKRSTTSLSSNAQTVAAEDAQMQVRLGSTASQLGSGEIGNNTSNVPQSRSYFAKLMCMRSAEPSRPRVHQLHKPQLEEEESEEVQSQQFQRNGANDFQALNRGHDQHLAINTIEA